MDPVNPSPDKPKIKIVLGPKVRAQFDKALDEGDRTAFEVVSKAVAAIAANPEAPDAGAGSSGGLLHFTPTDAARKAAAEVKGLPVTLKYSFGCPKGRAKDELRGPQSLDVRLDAGDFSSIYLLLIGAPSAHNELSLDGLRYIPGWAGGTREQFRDYVRELLHPRRWWLLGGRLRRRVIREIRWNAAVHCWEALLGPRRNPILLQCDAICRARVQA